MNDCPQCGFPMVWSVERAEVRCSIYGAHPEPVAERCECYTCQAQRARDARRAGRLRVVA